MLPRIATLQCRGQKTNESEKIWPLKYMEIYEPGQPVVCVCVCFVYVFMLVSVLLLRVGNAGGMMLRRWLATCVFTPV